MEIRIGKYSKDEGGSWVEQFIEGIDSLSYGGNYHHNSFLIHFYQFDCSIYVYDDTPEFDKLQTSIREIKNGDKGRLNNRRITYLKKYIIQLILDHITPTQFIALINTIKSDAKRKGEEAVKSNLRELIGY